MFFIAAFGLVSVFHVFGCCWRLSGIFLPNICDSTFSSEDGHKSFPASFPFCGGRTVIGGGLVRGGLRSLCTRTANGRSFSPLPNWNLWDSFRGKGQICEFSKWTMQCELDLQTCFASASKRICKQKLKRQVRCVCVCVCYGPYFGVIKCALVLCAVFPGLTA